MAPREKNNRKTTLNKKNVSPKKVEKPKRTPLKKKASARKVKNVATSKKIPLKMKVAAKKVTAPQRTSLKKKVPEKKKSAKSSAKKDSSSSGLKRATSKSSDERAARAARRNLAKEASITQEPRAKRARQDLDDLTKVDLEEIIVNSATAPGGEDSKSLPTIVNHVAAASSRCHLADHLTPCEAQTKKTSTRRDFN